MTRIDSQSGRLARLGFADAAVAAAMVEAWERCGTPEQIELVLTELPSTADPNLALVGLNRLVEARPGLFGEFGDNPDFARRVIAVLGASAALNLSLIHI